MFLGVGTGEAMNETPVTGDAFPPVKERRLRLAEAMRLMRALWSGERVDFEGEYYRAEKATVYDRPDEPVPVYIAASGPLAAKLAGRAGDGLIVTSGKRPELYGSSTAAAAEGAETAGRDPAAVGRMIEIKVSYDRDAEFAARRVPLVGRARAHAATRRAASRTRSRWSARPTRPPTARTRASSSPTTPTRSSSGSRPYVDLGFTRLVFHFPGDDQRRQLDAFCRDVLPRLRDRWS